MNLADALKQVGQDPPARALILEALRAYEYGVDYLTVDVRDCFTHTLPAVALRIAVS